MVDFIKAMDGTQIPYTEITEIEERGTNRSMVRTRNKKKYAVRGSASDLASKIEDETAHIIPATHGFTVVFADAPRCKDGEWETFSVDVIGWRTRVSHCERGRILESSPVIAGIYDFSQFWALVSPNGTYAPSNRDCPMNKKEWLESLTQSLVEDGFYPDDDNDNENNEGNDDGNENENNNENDDENENDNESSDDGNS